MQDSGVGFVRNREWSVRNAHYNYICVLLDLQHNKRDVIKPTTSASMKTLQCKL